MRDPSKALEIHPASNATPDHAGRMPQFYECGTCGHLHPVDWAGDCREDANRFTYDALDAAHPLGWLLFSEPEDY